MEVYLPHDQVVYLKRTGLVSTEALLSPDTHSPRTPLLLSEEEVVTLIDILTTRLAQIGFDINYELTSEGELIEHIVDRLGAMVP